MMIFPTQTQEKKIDRDGLVNWCLYLSLGLNELMFFFHMKQMIMIILLQNRKKWYQLSYSIQTAQVVFIIIPYCLVYEKTSMKNGFTGLFIHGFAVHSVIIYTTDLYNMIQTCNISQEYQNNEFVFIFYVHEVSFI